LINVEELTVRIPPKIVVAGLFIEIVAVASRLMRVELKKLRPVIAEGTGIPALIVCPRAFATIPGPGYGITPSPRALIFSAEVVAGVNPVGVGGISAVTVAGVII
jgi:hypothetical protein